MVDGVYNNDNRLGGTQGAEARVPLEVMAEFQVLTHQHTAEYGGASGVVVNASPGAAPTRCTARSPSE